MPGAGFFYPGESEIRPGTYTRVESARPEEINKGLTGVVVMPLFNWPYGPAKEFFKISARDRNAQMAKLGFNLFTTRPETLALRECLENAREVICYIPKAGTRAKANGTADEDGNILNAEAMYGGVLGNEFRYTVVANPDEGYDVTIFVGTEAVEEFEGLATVEELEKAGSQWIKFSGSGDLTPVAGVTLSGATPPVSTNLDITKFLDAAETVKWNTMYWPIDGNTYDEDGELTKDPAKNALMEAFVSKIRHLRDNCGKYVHAVCANYRANDMAITNVVNGVYKGDVVIDEVTAAAWVAGLDSSSAKTQSNTARVYKGATEVYKPRTSDEIKAGIQAGEFQFVLDDNNEVQVEYDINSLTDFSTTWLGAKVDKSYRKNRVIREYDALATRIQAEFPPNKFDNDEAGWTIMEAIGASILTEFQQDHALKNVDVDTDFLIDREASIDDEVWCDVAAHAVEAAEKLYFHIRTT